MKNINFFSSQKKFFYKNDNFNNIFIHKPIIKEYFLIILI